MLRMGIEIERKFLVAGEGWRGAVQGQGVRMRQGYLAVGGADQPSVRIRVAGERAWLTVKGPGGKVRAEFEYPIPVPDAEAMLALSPFTILGKTRFEVPQEGGVWTVDVFDAPATLVGLILAEIELECADTEPVLPDWLGDEVTADPRYGNAGLATFLAQE
jgi:adenylate cyclase